MFNMNRNLYYKLKNPQKKAFVKIKNFWWKLEISSPLNNATVYNYICGKQSFLDLTKFTIVEAYDWCDLDWKGTAIFDNKYKTGWLSPDGVFFGCSYECHSMQARFLHKCHEGNLEQCGWIKLARDKNNPAKVTALLGVDKNYNPIIPTRKQMIFLKECGINNFEDLLYKNKCKHTKIDKEK